MREQDRFERDDVVIINLSGGGGVTRIFHGRWCMHRFETVFERPAFIAFTVAGDPDYATSLVAAQTIIRSGGGHTGAGHPVL